MPRGFPELAVNLRAMAAWHRCKNPHSRVVLHVLPEEENNNSITVDSVISAVRNEHTFKEKAIKSNIFPLLTKSQFRTHKCIVRYSDKHSLSGKSPSSQPDTMNAVNCVCVTCSNAKKVTRSNRDTFHRYKVPVQLTGNSNSDDDNSHGNVTKYRAACLAPLYKSHEIQVHDRSFNCSAVAGNKLMPVICKLTGKLLQDKETALIDLALVRCLAQLELQSNGILPAHVMTLCEIMCWQLETRNMTPQQQVHIYKTKLQPILSKLQVSRQNFSQSGGIFCHVMIRGNRSNVLYDQLLVSHKYKNQDTINTFKTRKRKFTNDVNDTEGLKEKLSKHPRRNRGPVYMATCGLAKYRDRMEKHGMKLPREDEM